MRTRKFTLATYLALSVLIAFGGVSSCGGGGGGNSSRGPGDSIIIVPPPNRAPAMTQDLAPATTQDFRDIATEIRSGQSIQESIDSEDDVDYFQFVVDTPSTVTVTLDSDYAGIGISLLDSEGNVLYSGVTASKKKFRIFLEEAGKFYLKLLKHKSVSKAVFSRLVGTVYSIALRIHPAGNTEFVKLKPKAPLVGICRCMALLEPGETGQEVSLADFFEGPQGGPLHFEVTGEVPNGLNLLLDNDTGRLAISASRGADLGIYRFKLHVSEIEQLSDGRIEINPESDSVFIMKVNVFSLPRLIPGQQLVVEAVPGRKTAVALTSLIGPPDNIGNHLPIKFRFDLSELQLDRKRASAQG